MYDAYFQRVSDRMRLKCMLREWSLIKGRGGYKTGGGGHVKFYPYEKGGRKKF